jgi:peptidoglycan hydrolase CwlO-like protein
MLEKVLYIGTTLIVSVVTYLLGSRKRDVEIENTKLDNLEKSLKIYQTMINDMSTKIVELTDKIDLLEGHIEKLMEENKKLKRQKK